MTTSDPKIDPLGRLRHDLRTPLHQIIGYAELLEEQARESGDKECLEDLEKIRVAARRALEVSDRAVPPTPAEAPSDSGVFLDSTPPSTAAATGLRTPTPAVDPSASRILVVDDNEMNRDMLSRRLGSRGFNVEISEDGALALERLDAEGVDIVLLDVMMPGLSGIDVLRKVRERWSESDLPVIMVTARDATEDVVEALRAGANDYVTKPLDFPVVLARLEMQLTLKRQKAEIRRLADDLELRNRFIRGLFGRSAASTAA